jgi:hypothetical protein
MNYHLMASTLLVNTFPPMQVLIDIKTENPLSVKVKKATRARAQEAILFQRRRYAEPPARIKIL